MAPYPERNKRFQTSDNKNYARNKINADEELWSILTALKEESRTPGKRCCEAQIETRKSIDVDVG